MTQTPKPEERAPYAIEQDDTQGLFTPPFWLTGPGIERTFIRDRHAAELVQHFANAAFSAGLEQGKGAKDGRIPNGDTLEMMANELWRGIDMIAGSRKQAKALLEVLKSRMMKGHHSLAGHPTPPSPPSNQPQNDEQQGQNS